MISIFLAALALTVPPVEAGVPNRQPQVSTQASAVDVVFGSGSSIWMVRSTDGGRTFGAPLPVASVPALALGRHRGPRIAEVGKVMVVSAVFGTGVSKEPHAHGLPEGGNLESWRSTDSGKTWSKPVAINDVGSSAREGLHAMAVSPQGELSAVWLDLRAPGTRLYGATSRDAGASWSKNVLLYESPQNTICQCCHPSLASEGNGSFDVLFRNALDGSRDLYQLVWSLPRGPGPAQKVGVGTWKLDACPMDGGGLAVRDGEIVSAWRRDETVFLISGKGPEQALGHGKNVAMALTSKGPFVAWTDSGSIRVKRPSSAVSEVLSASGDFASLASTKEDGVIATWEENGALKIQVLR